MEYQSFQEHIYLKIGILLFFLVVTASCKHSSSAFTKKYITEAYFEKHYSLLDLEFNNFVTRELPLGSCEEFQDTFNVVPKLSVISRHLIGEGSHRRLSSSIGFKIQPESLSETLSHSCEVIIVERLPSGVFADPFELQRLIERGGNFEDENELNFWEELSCGVYSISAFPPKLDGSLVGELNRHQWSDPVLKELIEWDRITVKPKPEELMVSRNRILVGQQSTQSASSIEMLSDIGHMQTAVLRPSQSLLIVLREAVRRRTTFTTVHQVLEF